MGVKPLEITNVLVNISYYSHLLPLLIFFLFFKRNKGWWAKALLFYIAVSFINDSILLYLDDLPDRRIIYILLSIFTILEYTVFTFFLYSIIEHKIFKTIVIYSSIGFYAFAIYYFLSSKGDSFDSLTASIESILIVMFCTFYLFDQLNKPQVVFIYQDPHFWFVVAFLVYLSGTLFLFIQASNLEKSVRDNFWKINLFSNIIKNILFAIAFSIKKNTNTALESPYDDFFENTYKT